MKDNISVIRRVLQQFDFSLDGLVVATEVGTGAYFYLPWMCLFSGAEKVIVACRSTRFGEASSIIALCQKHLEESFPANMIDRVTFYEGELPEEILSSVDIFTNSGHLRPFDKKKIAKFKSTAVIPLLWEPWEFRPWEIDISECKKQNVTVVGTNEESIGLMECNGIIVTKMLFDLGRTPIDSSCLILGSSHSAQSTYKYLLRNKADVQWLSYSGREPGVVGSYNSGNDFKGIKNIDFVIIFENQHEMSLLDQNMINNLGSTISQDTVFFHITGNLDSSFVSQNRFRLYPSSIASYGYMSIQIGDISLYPVIKLLAAGLAVGTIVARKRLAGASIEDSISAAVNTGLGSDFDGGYLNYES